MRILIVKLSSLGDIVHAMPAVHDLRRAHPDAQVDWVVEHAFAAVLGRVQGLGNVIDCSLRRWRRSWWHAATRREWAHFCNRLRSTHYDAVLDLQGLTKSAVIARLAHGRRHGLANRTDGSSFEAPARWLTDHAIHIAARTHAVDRARELAARALGYAISGPPRFGLRARAVSVASEAPTLLLVHGSSRADKLWPESHWIAIGQQAAAQGWQLALPHAGELEWARVKRIATGIGPPAQVWPMMALDAVVDRMAATQGVIGVDSGISHIATALGLPHVQIYTAPTAWRTGPQVAHGHGHQVSVEAPGGPSVAAVWEAWLSVSGARQSSAWDDARSLQTSLCC